MKEYVKVSRYNPSVSFELYKVLLRRKQEANGKRISYKDLVEEWGVKQQYMANAIFRGIKQYDYRIWKEAQDEDSRRLIPTGGMERRNESRPLGLRAESIKESRNRPEQRRKAGMWEEAHILSLEIRTLQMEVENLSGLK